MKKIRKVVNLKVFDFKEHERAYALKSGKNMFGYTFQNDYYIGDKLIYNGPLYDNVEDMALYWLAFRVNVDQLKSLKKKLLKIEDRKFDIIENDDSVNISFDNGSSISYQGKNKDEFYNKVFLKIDN